MGKKFHILLADDDMDDRFFFEKALKEKEVAIPTRLTTVEDGEKLMQYLTNINSELPDVIFLDLNMPRKTGNDCLVEIKNSEKLKHIPIVIYSTSLYEGVSDVLYDQGAHYYLQKRDFFELSAAINNILTMLMNNPERPAKQNFIIK